VWSPRSGFDQDAERSHELSFDRFSNLSPAEQQQVLLTLSWIAGSIIGERIGYLLTAPFRKRSERWPH
jgi:hypothetical protein